MAVKLKANTGDKVAITLTDNTGAKGNAEITLK